MNKIIINHYTFSRYKLFLFYFLIILTFLNIHLVLAQENNDLDFPFDINQITKNNIDIINLNLEIEKQKKQIELYKLNNGFNINFTMNKISSSLDNNSSTTFPYDSHETLSLIQAITINPGNYFNGASFNLNNNFSLNYYDTNLDLSDNPNFSNTFSIGIDFSLKQFLSNNYIINLTIMEKTLENLELQLDSLKKSIYAQFLTLLESYYNTYLLIKTNDYNLYIEQNNLNLIKNRYSKDSYNYKNQYNKIINLQNLINYEKQKLKNINIKINNLLNLKINIDKIIESILEKAILYYKQYSNNIRFIDFESFKEYIKNYDDIKISKNYIEIDKLNNQITLSDKIPNISFSLNYNLNLNNILSSNFDKDNDISHSISFLINYSFDLNKNKKNKIQNEIDKININSDENDLLKKYNSIYETYLNIVENIISIKNNIIHTKNNLDSSTIELNEKSKKVSIFGEYEINRLKKQNELYKIQINNYYLQFYYSIIELNWYLNFIK